MAKSNRQLLITLGADTTTFTQKVKRAKDLTKELDSNFKLLSSSSKDFDKSLDGLGKKYEYLNDKIKVATTLNDVYNERLKDQQDRLNKSAQSMQQLEKELEQLKDVQKRSLNVAEWDDWQSEIEKVEDELKQVTKETKNFQDSVIGLHTAINQNQTNIQKMNAELAETKVKFDMLSRDKTFEEIKKDISETDRVFDNIKNSTDGFGKAVSDLKAEKAHLNTQMQKTNKLMDEYATDIAKSTSEMKKLENEIESLVVEYNAMKKAVDSMDGTEKHYKEWSDELDKLGSTLTSTNRLLDIHRNRVESLKDSYKQSENSIKQMEGSIKRVDNEIYNFGRQNNFKSVETHMESLRHEFDLLGSKMELLRSKYINFENSISGSIRESKLLKEQTKILREEFQAQNSAMNEYKLKLKELTNKKKELKDSIDSLKASMKGLDTNSTSFAKLSAEVGEFERSLQSVEDEMDDVNNKLRQMELNSNSTLTSINNNIQGQGRVWETVSGRIQTVGNAFTTAGQSMQSLGGFLTPVTMGVTALGTAIITTGKNFQEGMSKASAVMGATGQEVIDLEEKARELASTSRWTAQDVADAYNYMGMAGWSASESLLGIKGVMDLASAGATDLATTSDIVTDGLTAMQMGAEDTTKFVDIMSATMVKSNTNIELLGETLKYAGNVAGGLGIKMEDLSLAIGTMANAGIKGSMSGTAIRAGLTRLIAPTDKATGLMKKYGIQIKKTEEGNVDLRATMENLRESFGKMKTATGEVDVELQNMVAKTVFGQTAMNGWLSIINADSEKFKELAENIDKASASNGQFTATLEKQMNDNLAGDIRTLTSTIQESFLVVFEEIEEPLRTFVQKFTKGIQEVTKWFKGLDDATQMNIVKFVALAGVVAPVVSVFGFLLTGLGGTITTFGKMVGVIGKVATKFNLLKNSGVTLKGLFTNFGGSIKTLASTLKGGFTGALTKVTTLLGGGGAGLTGVLSSLSSVALPAIAVALGGLGVIFGDNEKALTSLIDKFGWFGTALSGVSEFLNGAFKGTFGQIGNLFGGIGDTIGAVFKGDFKSIGDIWSSTWSEMKSDAGSAWENITMTSTRSITSIRKYTEKDLGQVKSIFENTYGEISKVTSTNLEDVATNITKLFTDSRGKSLDLASETIDILRGTSDTMRVLFSGVKAEMDIDVAKARFTENLNNLLNTGGTTAEQLAKDFETAWSTIDANIIDGGQRIKQNASSVLEEFGDIASGKIEQGVDDIVSVLDDLDVRGIESLRGLGTNWNAIFAEISTSSKMTTEEMKTAILANIERLGLDTPQKLQEFKKALQYELEIASEQAGLEGQELGTELLDGIEVGVSEGIETTGQAIQEQTKAVTEKATVGAREGFELLPDSVKQELAKAGVSINEQGNVIVTDMAQKGREGAKAYIDEMNSELGNVSGVASTIQTQLDAIDSVRFGNVTKQLSEINKWLGRCTDSAVKTGASLVSITTISFGGTTKGLSEVNRWLKDNVTKSAKDTKTALADIKTVTFGSTTKGLSEINKWLRDNVTPNAKTAHSKLLTLSKFTFSGVVSGLRSVNTWLNTIKNNASTTRTALLSVANATKASVGIEGNIPIPDYSTESYNLTSLTRDSLKGVTLTDYKTSGGLYEPQLLSGVNAKVEPINTNNDALLKATLEQNRLLLQLLSQQKPVEVAVNVDGKQVAKASAKYIEKEIVSINNRRNRLGGILSGV